ALVTLADFVGDIAAAVHPQAFGVLLELFVGGHDDAALAVFALRAVYGVRDEDGFFSAALKQDAFGGFFGDRARGAVLAVGSRAVFSVLAGLAVGDGELGAVVASNC